LNSDLIATRLKNLRGSRTRDEVAESTGISVSALSMYEGGNRIPRDEIKVLLARLYGTTVGALFFNEEPHETCASGELFKNEGSESEVPA
jgi:transcriptional regulator with XRE-family HTH domain